MDEQADELDSSLICWTPFENFDLPSSPSILFDLSFGADYLCTYGSDNKLNCFSNNQARLNNLNVGSIPPEWQTQFIVSGYSHSCILSLDEVYYSNEEFDDVFYIYCIGDNQKGQREVPEQVRMNAGQVESMAAGPYSTCVKMKNKELICWGFNEYKLFYDSSKWNLDDMDIKGMEFFNDIIYKEDIGKYFNNSRKKGSIHSHSSSSESSYDENDSRVNINRQYVDAGMVQDGINVEINSNQNINEYFKNINAYSDDNYTYKSSVNSNQFERFNYFQNLANQQNIWFGPGTIQLSMGITETYCGIKKLPFNANNRNILSCWGKCDFGLCQIPSTFTTGAYFVSVGYDHICALKTLPEMSEEFYNRSHSLCWGGDNAHGQTTIPEDFTHYIDSIFAGKGYTCALKDNLNLRCWGISYYYNTKLDAYWRSISVGGRHSCGMQGGFYRCWGNNWYGQLEYGGVGAVQQEKEQEERKRKERMRRDIERWFCSGQGGEHGEGYEGEGCQGEGKKRNGHSRDDYYDQNDNLDGYETDDVHDYIINNIIEPVDIYSDEDMMEFEELMDQSSNPANPQGKVSVDFLMSRTHNQLIGSTLSIVAGWDYTCSITLTKNAYCWGLNMRGVTDVPYAYIYSKSLGVGVDAKGYGEGGYNSGGGGQGKGQGHGHGDYSRNQVGDELGFGIGEGTDHDLLSYDFDDFGQDDGYNGVYNDDNMDMLLDLDISESILNEDFQQEFSESHNNYQNEQSDNMFINEDIKHIEQLIAKEKVNQSKCLHNNQSISKSTSSSATTFRSHSVSNHKGLFLNNIVPKNYYHTSILASGLGHSCMAYKTISRNNCFSNDELICWGGNNEFGQITEPHSYYRVDASNSFASIQFNDIKKLILDVQVGDDFTCVEYFNYPNHVAQTYNIPAHLNHTRNINLFHSKGRTKLLCYGSNEYGQLGVPEDLHMIYHYSAGGGHVCSQVYQHRFEPSHYTDAERPQPSNAKLYNTLCWGSDSHGQASPPGYLLNKKVYSMSAGAGHTCVILYRYNSNGYGGRVGKVVHGGAHFSDPQADSAGHDQDNSNGNDNASKNQYGDVMWDGKLACWGLMYKDYRHDAGSKSSGGMAYGGNWAGQLWERMQDKQYLVDLGDRGLVPIGVSAGYDHDCVVGIRGRAYCKGEDEYGQCSLPEGR
eukprot:Mrub_00290.p1 GENE.Mrub_00290~~Mrub_00290.p1  ORF type:complete len:1198 (-),score=380.09 Mrub_00290:121-3615(-)